MSFSENEIINHNLKKLYNSNPQFLNVMDFELLDLNMFSHPQELVGEIESLDLIELDQNDTDYYLTEKGYDCVEAGGWSSMGDEVDEYSNEENVYSSVGKQSVGEYLLSEFKGFVTLFFVLLVIVSCLLLIGRFVNDEKLNPIPKELLKSFRFQADSLKQVVK